MTRVSRGQVRVYDFTCNGPGCNAEARTEVRGSQSPILPPTGWIDIDARVSYTKVPQSGLTFCSPGCVENWARGVIFEDAAEESPDLLDPENEDAFQMDDIPF